MSPDTPPLAMKLMTRSLFNLTKDVHTRLPREIRDLVYRNILTEHCLDEICRCSSLRLDKFPHTQDIEPGTSKAGMPDFAVPEQAFGPFVHELIETLYDVHDNLTVALPSGIPKYLDTDFFDTGFTLRAVRLHKLLIEGCLDIGIRRKNIVDLIDLNNLSSDLNALLACKWSAKFELNIAFHSTLHTTYWDEEDIGTLAETLHKAWQVLEPFVAQAEVHGARVHVAMNVGSRTFEYKKDEQSMLLTANDWFLQVEDAFPGRYREYRAPKMYRNSPCPESSCGCYAAFCCVFCCCGWVVYVPARWCWNKFQEHRKRK
jgi:hypothetical protein